jgi:hypothetical protein
LFCCCVSILPINVVSREAEVGNVDLLVGRCAADLDLIVTGAQIDDGNVGSVDTGGAGRSSVGATLDELEVKLSKPAYGSRVIV